MDNRNNQGQNLRTHCAYSKVAVLPDENESDYTELFQDLQDEWHPEGLTEEQEVKGLADAYWIARRLDRYWAAEFSRVAAEGRRTAAARDRKEEQEKFRVLLEQVALTENAEELNALLDDAGGAFSAMKTTFVPDTHRLAVKTVTQLMEQYEQTRSAQAVIESLATLGFDSDSIDQQLRSYERVNAKIARHLKMLVQLKSMKPILFRTSENVRSAPKALPLPK
jgi:hypothetical protein